MKITNLKVQNFKAFYGEIDEPYEFNFLGKYGNAKNILLYGENGSGKSSLYWTLHHILTTTDTNILKKYKNLFAEKANKPINIEMNFDNGKNFIYDEATDITVDEATQEEFDRLTKIKTFLTYENIFLVNELFDKKISVERFVNILDMLYGESLHHELMEYNRLRLLFKQNYLEKSCTIKESFEAFDEEHNIEKYWEDIYNNTEYEDIPKIDKETDKPMEGFYETVYYYSDEAIATLESIKASFEVLNEDFNINTTRLEDLIFSIDDVLEVFNDKSYSTYITRQEDEKILVIDMEAIDTVVEIVLLETYFEEVFTMVDDYKKAQELVSELNDKLNLKVEMQVSFINNVLENHFKNNLKIEFLKIDYLEFFLDNLDTFNPIKYKVQSHAEEIPYRYSKFLNEAKISSINFAFYISIIKSYAELGELKLLVLDDLLISLDMSNRDVILSILQEHFSDYQIIFLTHDRAFFDRAKQILDYHQRNQWKYFEMYVDIDDTNNIEIPHLKIDDTYSQRAKDYFMAKDYPASANYLRKEVERLYHKKLGLDKLERIVDLARKEKNLESIESRLKGIIGVLRAFELCEGIPIHKRTKNALSFLIKSYSHYKNLSQCLKTINISILE